MSYARSVYILCTEENEKLGAETLFLETLVVPLARNLTRYWSTSEEQTSQ